jgi:hypothetical protein
VGAARKKRPVLYRVVSAKYENEVGWSAYGHTFGDDMMCNKCRMSYAHHQQAPKLCANWQRDPEKKVGSTPRPHHKSRRKPRTRAHLA